jgi:hypothetical protein
LSWLSSSCVWRCAWVCLCVYHTLHRTLNVGVFVCV